MAGARREASSISRALLTDWSLRIEVKVLEWRVIQSECAAPEKGETGQETIALIKEKLLRP